MLDVELFGTEVTVGGMTRHRPGRLETAERGTILLNNIDRLPATEQGRLLRSFEDGVITSTAGGIDRAIHCRIVAAAARNLTTLRESGEFRSDLYYFLNTVTLELPPLRERHEDLPALMVELLARAAARLKRPAPSLTRALSKHLFEHDWPGNLRELAQFADRVVLGIERSMPSRTVSQLESLPERVDRFEESALRQTLRATHGDVRSCLDLLKIPRKTFYDKLTRYGVDIGAYRASIVDHSRK
jgi:two-component system C4-dicarboxylate transport response regulator DctD